MEEIKNIQLYASVDSAGHILDVQMGENIIPTDNLPYFFRISEVMAGNVDKYMVAVHNMQPTLVLREEVEAE